MSEFYIATVKILVRAGSVDEACDGMSELLSCAIESGCDFVQDWGYPEPYDHPAPIECNPDSPDYQEGDFLYMED